MIFFLQNTPIFTSLISSHSIFKICERQDNLSVLKLTNGVGNAKCGVDGLESLQECHFYSVFFPLLFPILVDFFSNFGGFYFQGSLGVNFTSVRILHALLKPPWTGTSPAKVSITKATCWASHLLVFSFLMYCCIVLH